MEFTGERFHPDGLREIWYEHFHRYVFATHFTKDKDVLDCACGEGYGSFLLSQQARSVVGVDISSETVDHASSTYRRGNLDYMQADASSLPMPDDSFDVIVSFETIEHLTAQRAMLGEFRRVLRPDGVLVVSSPDRRVYSDERDYENEFHVAELYKSEFEQLLGAQFPAYRMLGQKLVFASVIWDTTRDGARYAASSADRDSLEIEKWNPDPMYWIAVAANDRETLERDVEPGLNLFMDRAESVYEHYYHEIRKNMQAGAIIAERDERIACLEKQLNSRRRWWQFWG